MADVVASIKQTVLDPQSPHHHAAYKNLAYISDTYGPRMWGSEQMAVALEYLKTEVEKMGFDKVTMDPLEDIQTWERGVESLTLFEPRAVPQPLNMIGLGLSQPGDVKAEVVVVKNFDELDKLGDKVKDKIVCYNFDWNGYSGTKDYRLIGADRASKYGAKAMLMRSIASFSINSPHTGFVRYGGEVPKIPAAAISVEDAEMFQRMQKRGQKIVVQLTMDSKWITSRSDNLLAEITGSEFPEQILLMGGHFDSWDTGSQTGAMDDGGGVMVTLQALKVLKDLNIKPKRTIRFIAWSGEEMSRPDKGAFQYATLHKDENHILALEDDHGSTKAVGFGFTGSYKSTQMIRSLIRNYIPELYYIQQDDGEMVDTAPLGQMGVPMVRNIVKDNATRDYYFKYHHTAGDNMSVMNPDDMDSNVIAIASLFYLVADAEQTLPNTNCTQVTPYSFQDEKEQSIKPKDNLTINYTDFIQKLDGPYSEYYQIVDKELLGKGGFGEVCKVKFKLNNEIRAMKIIKKDTGTINDNFRKEFSILKQLDHPNILKLYHSFEDDELFYIISELCEGGNLFDYMLSQDELSEKEVCKIMWQLITAVNVAHQHQVVHRDIKLDNILLDDEISIQIKLIDWGLLSMFDGEKLHQKCGSLHYVAPEVLEGSYDEKCDIWSCGVVLYTLLCNDPPFQGKDTQEILSNIHKGQVEFKYKLWNRYSNEVKSLLQEMLNKDPSLRPTAQQILDHSWFEGRQSEQIASQEYKESLVQLNQFAQESNSQSLAQQRFLQAIILFISTEVVHKKDKQSLHKIFRKLDKNADGTISKEELQTAFRTVYPDNELTQRVDRIFEFLDINSSGQLDYSEFVAATCKLTDIESKLKIAFDFFDDNKDGNISLEELFKVIGPNESWKDIFNTFDSNSDQKISYSEFCDALSHYVRVEQKL